MQVPFEFQMSTQSIEYTLPENYNLPPEEQKKINNTATTISGSNIAGSSISLGGAVLSSGSSIGYKVLLILDSINIVKYLKILYHPNID